MVHISEESVDNFKKLVTYVHTGRIDIHAHDVAGTSLSPLSLSLSLSLTRYAHIEQYCYFKILIYHFF